MSKKAKNPPLVSLGTSVDYWAAAIQPVVLNLSEAEQTRLLKRNGVTSFEELALTLAKRFPSLEASPKFTLGGEADDQGTYVKGPHFDKEPYDKGPNHDKGGFDRTFSVAPDFQKLVFPINEKLGNKEKFGNKQKLGE